ncbi:MAG: riboflavin synthase [bacterium]|nr:riboflavin synthase [bacterium]
MFTGIIEQQGIVQKRARNRLHIKAASGLIKELSLGASVAVNGACLTVSDFPTKHVFSADVMPETFERTTLGDLAQGDAVNLELPLKAGDKLGGHMVQGHVDGTARLTCIRTLGNSRILSFSAPKGITRFVVEKGSIAIDGVSLTVIGVDAKGFSVGIIPHTLKHTTLAHLAKGGSANVEVDIIAKYVRAFNSSHKK